MTRADPSTATRVVLASASPARLSTLRAAGLDPDVVVSGVDEEGWSADSPSALALLLAERKCAAVAERLRPVERPTLVIGCDSVLELHGVAHGKPIDAATAAARWRVMRGGEGVLHTGHGLRLLGGGAADRRAAAVAGSVVHFADLADDEIDAYVATGEPLAVAGGFTLDGLGGAYVRSIDGDPHTVVGISLPLLRDLVGELGLRWHQLWRR
ncbi:Maf family protein [soil metagenome]